MFNPHQHESHAIYVHIPFCRIRCTYCAFNTYIDQNHLIEDYVQALMQEIRFIHQTVPDEQLRAHTLYFGGGTPSLLTPNQVERIIDVIYQEFDVASLEVSLEANPGTVDFEKLSGFRQAGVTRLSMGMQSAHQSELQLFGRLHQHQEVISAVEQGRQAGFENISLDLIYGVPNQTRKKWQESVKTALDLSADHLSLYALSLEPGTVMTKQVKYNELPTPDSDVAADMYEDATELLDAAGFIQYEISNWGLSGKMCEHNLQYWRNLPYLGLGAGSHGYASQTRTVNAMRPEVYIERMNTQWDTDMAFPKTPATIKYEPIDRDTDMAETLLMGLRLLDEGLSLSAFERRYEERVEERFGDEIERLTYRGLLVSENNRLKLTKQARLISNYVFQHFVEPA